MMNWVETAASTETRWRSMRRRVSSAVKRSSTTQGAPSTAGVKCAVQSAKPKGAGSTEPNTSARVSSPEATASSWKWSQRAWWCITHLGRPVVPEVELSRNRSFTPSRRCARSAGAARPFA